MSVFSQRLAQLKHQLKQQGYDAYLVPVQDEFQGEYTPAYAQRLPWLTGFSGSAGMAIVCAEGKSVLFVDGRYTLQAQNEVNASDFDIENISDLHPTEWLKCHFGQSGGRVGLDARLHTAQQYHQWRGALPESIALDAALANCVDAIWTDQPAPPAEPVEAWGMEFAGEKAASKVKRLCIWLEENDLDAVLLTAPDSINWLLNIRGADIPFNPLLLGYALVRQTGEVQLFLHERSFSEVVELIEGVEIKCSLLNDLYKNLKVSIENISRLSIDLSHAPVGLEEACETAGVQLVALADPVAIMKAEKNAVEQEGMRRAHVRDGVAVTEFLHWLDNALASGEVSEMQASDALEAFRAKQEHYRGASFATIAGSGPHGAIVHYRVTQASDRAIGKGELFLCDSGGQYLDGTTDITRTVVHGTPSDDMRTRYTQVLKGHIAVAAVTFPEGTAGSQLDTLARQFLWADGVDYDHGTGHGVGSYLCVHEGPQRISKRAGDNVALKPGMVLSNEPGYYKDGEYGIRIENLVLVVEKGRTEKGKKRLGFDTITLAPIDTRLIDTALLSEAEIAWLEAYHAEVVETLQPHLSAEALAWLKQAVQLAG